MLSILLKQEPQTSTTKEETYQLLQAGQNEDASIPNQSLSVLTAAK